MVRSLKCTVQARKEAREKKANKGQSKTSPSLQGRVCMDCCSKDEGVSSAQDKGSYDSIQGEDSQVCHEEAVQQESIIQEREAHDSLERCKDPQENHEETAPKETAIRAADAQNSSKQVEYSHEDVSQPGFITNHTSVQDSFKQGRLPQNAAAQPGSIVDVTDVRDSVPGVCVVCGQSRVQGTVSQEALVGQVSVDQDKLQRLIRMPCCTVLAYVECVCAWLQLCAELQEDCTCAFCKGTLATFVRTV